MLTDEEFVEEWEAKNHRQKRPPSLSKVVWTLVPKCVILEHESNAHEGSAEEGEFDGDDRGSDKDATDEHTEDGDSDEEDDSSEGELDVPGSS